MSRLQQLTPGLAAVALSIAVGLTVSTTTVPPRTALLAATAMVALLAGVAAWNARPDLVLTGFVFALPLMKGTDAGNRVNQAATIYLLAIGSLSIATRPTVLPRRIRQIVISLAGITTAGILTAVYHGTTDTPDLAKLLLKPISWIVIVYLVFQHIDTREKTLRLLRAMIWSAVAVALYAIYQWATHTMPAPLSGGAGRATSTFEHWNELGGFMALMIAPTLAYGLEFGRRRLATIACGLEIAALLLSATLGSVLALVVAAVFAFGLWRIRPGAWFALAFAPIVGVLIVSLAAPATLQKVQRAGQRAQDRAATYSAGVNVIRHNVVFGTGSISETTRELGSSGYGATAFGVTSQQPHTSFLSIWVERGILGFVFLASLAFVALRAVREARPKAGEQGFVIATGLMLGTIAFLVQNLTNNLLIHARLGLFFLVLVAVAVRLGAADASPRHLTPSD